MEDIKKTSTIFNYEIIKETEKAVYAKIPYYEETNESKKKHKQLFYECWIPKAVLDKGIAKDFVIAKKNQIRLTNKYQKHEHTPHSWKTFGEYAPEKTKYTIMFFDQDKYEEMIKFYENKYENDIHVLLNDHEGKNGVVTKEDYKIIVNLMFPKMNNINTLKKPLIIYK